MKKYANTDYFDNLMRLEPAIKEMSPAKDILPEAEYPTTASLVFDADLSDMTEHIHINYTDGRNVDYTFPLLTTLNAVLSQLPDVMNPDYYSGPTKQFMFEAVSSHYDYLLAAIDDISSSPTHFSIGQYLIYFNSYFIGAGFISSLAASNAARLSRDELFLHARNCNYEELFYHRKCSDWTDIIGASLLTVACSENPLRKCNLCGKYFIPENRSDEMYCRFPNGEHDGKPCKEAYKRIAQDARELKNESLRLNKIIYNRLRNRSAEELDLYKKLRDEAKTTYTVDLSAETSYLDWLREYEEKTRK
ncbi:MAG: DUF6076 domain-containing protein [Clostridia bacterium]|nr:DUF6076 domain-containing protein [Clostridia bacterium]